jgi:hypothetical protein
MPRWPATGYRFGASGMAVVAGRYQNTQRRSEQAVQKKLDAIADGLSDLMDHFAGDKPERVTQDDLSKDIGDLRAAVGLEEEL